MFSIVAKSVNGIRFTVFGTPTYLGTYSRNTPHDVWFIASEQILHFALLLITGGKAGGSFQLQQHPFRNTIALVFNSPDRQMSGWVGDDE